MQLTMPGSTNNLDIVEHHLVFSLTYGCDAVLFCCQNPTIDRFAAWNLLVVDSRGGHMELCFAIALDLGLPLRGTESLPERRLIVQEERGCN